MDKAMSGSKRVIVVGGGLAGLSCSRALQAAGVETLLLEASDRVGGRVRTDRVEGFLLDRGFQVFLEAYPEAQSCLDYPALELHSFQPGALLRVDRGFRRVTDPWRRPLQALADLLKPALPFRDLLATARLRREALRGSLDALFEKPETPTIDWLRERGVGPVGLERFFRPFFGGVFLERDLATSSRMFEFVFRMMALGSTSLPARGMEAIPLQIAGHLRDGSVRCGTRVESVSEGQVTLATGEKIEAGAVVVAVEGPAAAQLLPELPADNWRSVSCRYFAAERAPLDEPMLLLGGSGAGVINNLAVLTNVCPSYGPAGAALISVTTLSESHETDRLVADELARWFGPQTSSWRPLRTYRIETALPDQRPPRLRRRTGRVRPGVFCCGDYLETASINGAMVSGRKAAEAVLKEM